MKTHPFSQKVLMELQNYMLIGLLRITEKRTVFLLVMEYCLIMKDQNEVKHLLQEKLQEQFAEIYLNQRKTIFLGNLDSKRDWGYAKDYIRSMDDVTAKKT